MTNVNREFRYDSTHHPGDDELIAYLRGRLTERGQESVQSHLVECDECLELFKDVRDFFESHRESDHAVTSNMSHEWKVLWEQIKDEERKEEHLIAGAREGFRSNRAMGLALAAMLLVAIGIGVWAVIQQRQRQQLARELEVVQQHSSQLQNEKQNLEERAKQLEQENLELQERIRLTAQSGGPQRAEIRKPELNAPIYDLYARNFTRRSAGPSEVNRIKLPASAKSMVLILNGEGIASASSYGIEILSPGGQMIWRAKGLRRDHLGNFTLTVDRSFLGKGTYSLKLYDTDGKVSKSLAEYVMAIE